MFSWVDGQTQVDELHKLRRPIAVPIYRAVGVVSLVVFAVVMLLGMPRLGGLVLLPWLSIALIRNPGILLAAYLYIPLYKPVAQSTIPVDVTVWLAALCVCRTMLELNRGRVYPFRTAAMFWSVFVFLLLSTTFTSEYLDVSTVSVARTLTLTVVPLLLVPYVARESDWLSQVLKVTLVFSVVFSLLGLGSMAINGASRLSLTSDTIGAGRIAIMGLLVAPAVIPRHRWKPIALVFVAICTLGAALASGSRGPLLAAFVAAFAIYALPNRWFAIRSLIVVSGGIAAVAFVMSSWADYVASEQSLYRIRILIKSALGDGEPDASSSIRLDLMGKALEMWGQRPIVGWGPGSFAVHPPLGWEYPHNAILQVGAELGTLAVLWFLLFAASAIFVIYRRLSEPWAIGIGILTIFAIVSAQFSNDLYDNRWLWGMLLLSLSMENLVVRAQTDIHFPTRVLEDESTQDP
ncbi:MAG: O-antigen ligase family protein [Thermomicrobiales bacterium]|nr:O-antigen ligase family protein [Thermomicrobiales bacterium]MCO5219218.1 O-antigen ligase family protein [Thermomicrobiales bacterium]MCO5225063.1 O-antigen ligase family protein [Thermomicrobiales bacterium]MCO5228115.1 O-antigen ligase family protein [Thermomicrobiales bacterium]